MSFLCGCFSDSTKSRHQHHNHHHGHNKIHTDNSRDGRNKGDRDGRDSEGKLSDRDQPKHWDAKAQSSKQKNMYVLSFNTFS